MRSESTNQYIGRMETNAPLVEEPLDINALKLGATALPALAACSVVPVRPSRPYIGSDDEAARFCCRDSFRRLMQKKSPACSVGCARWLTEQFAVPSSETGWDWLNRRGYDAIHNDTRYYDSSYPGDQYDLASVDDARQTPCAAMCASALSEFFVVSLTGLDFGWRSHGTLWATGSAVGQRVLKFPHIAGRRHAQPGDTGFYLNTKGNQAENPATGRVPDEKTMPARCCSSSPSVCTS